MENPETPENAKPLISVRATCRVESFIFKVSFYFEWFNPREFEMQLTRLKL